MKNGSAQPFIRWAALLAGVLLSAAAHATLIGPVTVKLIAPGGNNSDPSALNLTQATDVLSGAGAIGSMMLDDEYIKVVGNSLRIRLNAGSDAGDIFTTGYLGSGGQHARYEFSGLGVAGNTIVSLNVSALDFDGGGGSGFYDPSSLGIASFVDLLTPSTISFEIDELQFVNGHRFVDGGYNYMDVTIDLVLRADGDTQPLPEPGSLALVLLGMGLVWRARRTD